MSAKRNTRVVQEHRRGAPKAPSQVEAPSTCSSSSIPRGAAVAGEAMANRAAALARSRAYRALHRRRAARTQAISTILDGELSLKKTVDAIKKVLVLDALKNNRWFRRRAAAELKVTYRIFNNMVSHLGLDALHKSMRAAMRKGAGSSSGKRTDPFDLFSIHLPYGESGVMDYDPLTDSLRCHFCGERFKNLAQHARKVHGLSSSDYRELAGLNRRTRLISQGVRERLREVTAPRCERLRAEGRKRSWGEDPELLARAKAAAVEASKSGMRPEGRRHRRESWEADEARKAKLSERNRRINQEQAKLKSPRAIREKACALCHSILPKEMSRYRYCTACKPKAVRQWRERSRLKTLNNQTEVRGSSPR